MHMVIYALVDASTHDDALATGKSVFDRLVGADPHAGAFLSIIAHASKPPPYQTTSLAYARSGLCNSARKNTAHSRFAGSANLHKHLHTGSIE